MAFITKKKLLIGTVVLPFIAGIAGGGYYFYKQYSTTKSQLEQLKSQAPNNASAEENQKTVSQVAKLMDLPSDQPTVATITDKEKLKDQPFFSRADNGDKVLIFAASKKAIIYRPSTNKIVDIAPINISNATPSGQTAQPTGKVAGATASTPTTKPLSVLLVNGTDSSGLTNKFEASVKKVITGATVTKEQGQKQDHDKSVIVVSKDEFKDAADKLSKELGISLGDSPYGEDLAGKADIVVLFGTDKK